MVKIVSDIIVFFKSSTVCIFLQSLTNWAERGMPDYIAELLMWPQIYDPASINQHGRMWQQLPGAAVVSINV